LLKCLALVNGLSLFWLYFTTFFPFCQIGKVGNRAFQFFENWVLLG